MKKTKRRLRLNLQLILAMVFVLLAIGFGSMFAVSLYSTQPAETNIPESTITYGVASQAGEPASTIQTASGFSSSPSPEAIAVAPKRYAPDMTGSYLGHLPYAEALSQDLILIASYASGPDQRFERLDGEAGKALMQMIYAAREVGVWILPVSGFRTIALQKELFEAQVQKQGSTDAAAKVSAPPGFSEHHSGFAVDLADGAAKTDISLNFEQTTAFQWLTHHAHQFGFELSFPPNNAQGVSYEPWHWRFVGTKQGQQIFASARTVAQQ